VISFLFWDEISKNWFLVDYCMVHRLVSCFCCPIRSIVLGALDDFVVTKEGGHGSIQVVVKSRQGSSVVIFLF
jgi:hypothetical protein